MTRPFEETRDFKRLWGIILTRVRLVDFRKQPADDSDRVTQNVSPGEEILSLKTMRLLFSHFFQGSY